MTIAAERLQNENDKLRAENERLKAALTSFGERAETFDFVVYHPETPPGLQVRRQIMASELVRESLA